jgi:hypothetical protein
MMNRISKQATRWRVKRQGQYDRDREKRLERSYSVIAPERQRLREKAKEQRGGQSDERTDRVIRTGIK